MADAHTRQIRLDDAVRYRTRVSPERAGGQVKRSSGRDPSLLYLELDRRQWRGLRESMPMVLTQQELDAIAGLGERLDLAEVADVYLLLSRLIHLRVAARQRLYAATSTFLGELQTARQVPFVIGIAGSVAVGKSTTARLLATLQPAGTATRRSTWSPPTASSTRRASSSAAASCTERDSPSPTTAEVCCALSPR